MFSETEKDVYSALFSPRPKTKQELTAELSHSSSAIHEALSSLIKQNRVVVTGEGNNAYEPAILAVVRNSHIQSRSASNPLAAYALQSCDTYIPRWISKSHLDLEILLYGYQNRLNTLLIGHTGTGKTHSIRWLSYILGVPYMRINLNGGTTVDDLVGQWVPANKPNKYIWVDGQLAAFMRNGGILVCDELNASPADINMVFNPVLDDERRLVLVQKESEVLYAHPEFWLISTINPDGDYEGTKPMNHALRDRFPIIMNYHYELDIESKLIPDEALLKLIYKLRESSKIYTKVSTRTGIQVIKNRALYGSDTALELFISRFTRDEQPVVRELASIMAKTLAGKPPTTSAEDPAAYSFTTSATSSTSA